MARATQKEQATVSFENKFIEHLNVSLASVTYCLHLRLGSRCLGMKDTIQLVEVQLDFIRGFFILSNEYFFTEMFSSIVGETVYISSYSR